MPLRRSSSSKKHRHTTSPHADHLESYWIWRGLFGSYQTLKEVQKQHRDTQRISYLRTQIILQYLKNFFYFPIWLIKFLTPSYMKGKVNVWTNLKTIIREREFHPLRMAVLSQVIFLYALAHIGFIAFIHYSSPTYAATYTWTQTVWSGGATTTPATHPGDRTGWSSFFVASSTIFAGDEVTLSFIIATSSHTTDEDFAMGITSTVAISGTGVGASLILLKPVGASCSLGAECNSGICDENNLCYEPPCAGLTSIDYEGQTYGLVEIGTQCWFAEHLNVGTKLAGASTMPSNNSIIEKWCYNNNDANCASGGGLYTWAETMQLDPSCNTTTCAGSITEDHQGICPSGWHIPTDDEYKTLEVYLGMCTGAGTGCVDAIGWRGTDQGTQLKVGGASGFAAVLSGGRFPNGSFNFQGSTVYLWSASEDSSSLAWRRGMDSSEARVSRYDSTKTFGFAVRCIKN